MTGTVLSAYIFVQVVTNWGPVQKGEDMSNWFAGAKDFIEYRGDQPARDYRQTATVDSQEVLRVTLPDNVVVTNVLKSTLLRTITIRGHQCPDIIWDRTNVTEAFTWVNVTVCTGLWTNAYLNVALCTNWCIDTTLYAVTSKFQDVQAKTIGTTSNQVAVEDVVALVRRSKLSAWDKTKAGWTTFWKAWWRRP